MLIHLESPSWLAFAHAWSRARGCDFEATMRVGEALNDPRNFTRVFEHGGAGWFFWRYPLGWLAVTFHEDEGPQMHFWAVPGAGPWAVLRIARAVLPTLLDNCGGFVNACLPDQGVHALARRLKAQDLGGGRYRWEKR